MNVHDPLQTKHRGVGLLLLLAALVTGLWLLAWTSSGGAAATAAVPIPEPARAESASASRPVEAAQPIAAPALPAPRPVAAAALAPAELEEPAPAPALHWRAPEEEPKRPDDSTPEEQAMFASQREMLLERLERLEPNPSAESELRRSIADRLIGRNMPEDALATLDCRRSLCRFELLTRGRSSLGPIAEVRELMGSVRDLGETWMRATEVEPGRWSVEAFAPTAGYNLTGPSVE